MNDHDNVNHPKHYNSSGIICEHGKHRTYDYMEDQCHYLIDQLVDSQEQ